MRIQRDIRMKTHTRQFPHTHVTQNINNREYLTENVHAKTTRMRVVSLRHNLNIILRLSIPPSGSIDKRAIEISAGLMLRFKLLRNISWKIFLQISFLEKNRNFRT